jgi:hypothetical protein
MIYSKLRSVAGIINFFIPVDVAMGVLLIFSMENAFEQSFNAYVPSDMEVFAWVAVYIFGIGLLGLVNYWSADAEEREDLSEDLDEL